MTTVTSINDRDSDLHSELPFLRITVFENHSKSLNLQHLRAKRAMFIDNWTLIPPKSRNIRFCQIFEFSRQNCASRNVEFVKHLNFHAKIVRIVDFLKYLNFRAKIVHVELLILSNIWIFAPKLFQSKRNILRMFKLHSQFEF